MVLMGQGEGEHRIHHHCWVAEVRDVQNQIPRWGGVSCPGLVVCLCLGGSEPEGDYLAPQGHSVGQRRCTVCPYAVVVQVG